jgi:hypothetical protein
MPRTKGAVLDKFLQKLISRKLLVWIVSSIAVLLGAIDGDQWVEISMVYIGSEAAIDSIIALRAGSNSIKKLEIEEPKIEKSEYSDERGT